MAGMIGLAVVVADAMMLDTVLGLDVRGDDARATQGRHGWGGRGEVHGWSLRQSSGRSLADLWQSFHFPSCSPVVVVVVVAHVFEQRLTRLAYVLVRVCLRVDVCLSAG